MNRTASILIALLLAGPANSQDIGERLTISSLVGDTLKPVERNQFGFFPGIEGFRWAVFFLDGDSVVSAKINYEEKGGIGRDTVIMDCGTLRSVHSQISRAAAAGPDFARLILRDGTMVSGQILGETATKLVVATQHLGQLVIPLNEVQTISRRQPDQAGEYSTSFKDPNETRAFIMPTANTIPAGSGYVADYELLFFTAAVGVTDWFMVNAGTLLVPVALENEVIYYGFKARVFEIHDRVAVALGLQMLSPLSADESLGLAYGVISIGNSDAKANLAFGNAFSTSGGSSFAMGISADARVSESIKLLGELWILPDTDVAPLILGVRFFGSRLSGDLGLMYPIGEDLGSPIGIPVANIVYNF